MFLLFSAGEAFACSLLGPEVLAVAPDPSDLEAPAAPALVAIDVRRGVGPRGGMATSCDDLGFVTITVARPDDDPDLDDAVGYHLALVDGVLPEGLTLSDDAWLGPDLSLIWIDGATDDQEALSFTLSLTPSDAAGNLGEPLLVDVADPGSVGSVGCDALGGRGSAAWVLGAAALLRRRRARAR